MRQVFFRGQIVASAIVVAVATGSCTQSKQAEFTPARNAIVICIDTLRASHVGCYGYDRDTTPFIDEIAAGGVVFERTLAHSNWTVPATASLMTSTYPNVHGAGVEGEVKDLRTVPPRQIVNEVSTLGQILSKKGFKTSLLSANPYLYGRWKSGFDVANVGRRSATEVTDEFIAWVRDIGDQRFFSHIQYMDLHQPIEPPEEFFNYFDAGVGGTRGDAHRDWNFGRGEYLDSPAFTRYRAHRVAAYDGALRFIDSEIARLSRALEELGLLDGTLLVITSDHGEEFWDHVAAEIELGGDPRGFYGIGHGHSMYQELLAVPLILAGGGVPSFSRYPSRVGHVDVAPTILDMLAMPVPASMQGASLLPGMRRHEPFPDSPLLAESPAYGPDSRSIIKGNWKLVVRDDGHKLLFNLESDPLESRNRFEQEAEIVAELEAILSRLVSNKSDHGPAVEFDKETEAQLRELGYIE